MEPGRRRFTAWRVAALGIACAFALLPGPARAAFHLMEIEQVIGGVDGDPSAQAVQLKMRLAGQQFVVGNARLIVRDANGANPVTLSTFPAPLTPIASGACREILLATAAMQNKTNPPLDANGRDFLMAAIPQSYLAKGTLTFEDTIGTVYWRTSWGGYSADGSVVQTPAGNDDSGNANPAFAGPLPTAGASALQFTPACNAVSTSNDLQYAVKVGGIVLKANDAAQFAVVSAPQIPALPDWLRLWLAVALGSFALLGTRALRYRRGS